MKMTGVCKRKTHPLVQMSEANQSDKRNNFKYPFKYRVLDKQNKNKSYWIKHVEFTRFIFQVIILKLSCKEQIHVVKSDPSKAQ